MLEGADLLANSTSTRDAVSRCCVFFREQERFDCLIGFHLIGALLGLDPKTVWEHWEHFRMFGLKDDDPGRPSCLTEEQIESIIQYSFEQFYAMVSVIATRLAHFIRDHFHLDIQLGTLRKLWICVTQ
jgi:hypothetical protein